MTVTIIIAVALGAALALAVIIAALFLSYRFGYTNGREAGFTNGLGFGKRVYRNRK